MFCVQCGKKLADNARFCSDCGTKVLNSEIRPASIQETPATDILSGKVTGALHWEAAKLSSKLAQNYVQNVMRRDLDEFIANAERDVENVFSEVDTYFRDFLKQLVNDFLIQFTKYSKFRHSKSRGPNGSRLAHAALTPAPSFGGLPHGAYA